MGGGQSDAPVFCSPLWSTHAVSTSIARTDQTRPSAVMVTIARKRLRLPRTVRRTPLANAERAFRPAPMVYHSISEMGLGAGFVVMDVTLPLLKRMSRSAMSASAALCVTITIVMPSRREVSWRSCRICLPVW